MTSNLFKSQRTTVARNIEILLCWAAFTDQKFRYINNNYKLTETFATVATVAILAILAILANTLMAQI